MINMYGITETTVHVTQCVLTPDLVAGAAPGRTPIGVPLPNARVRISLDGGVSPCADGELGEMVVFGGGVAAGYLGRPELSAERFPELDGQRGYRSGDWGVRTPEGTLLYIGRVDDQVKIRGHRIELGEIEGVLARHEDVAAAACVVHREPDRPDRLVACVVGRDGAPDARGIRRWLTGQVPHYLVPARIIGVDDLPTNASGKVDRAALTALATDSFRTPA
jgi:acyl-coenzyme A synthetase/AMP-(fatty) acid ligase